MRLVRVGIVGDARKLATLRIASEVAGLERRGKHEPMAAAAAAAMFGEVWLGIYAVVIAVVLCFLMKYGEGERDEGGR